MDPLTLQEVLSDPMIAQVNAADGIDETTFATLLLKASQKQRPSRINCTCGFDASAAFQYAGSAIIPTGRINGWAAIACITRAELERRSFNAIPTSGHG